MRCLADPDKTISSSQFFFSILFKVFMFVLNMAIPTIISSYFSTTPMFFLPPGDWFGPLGYLFSFPKAPIGAVSTTVWTTVCGRVLSLVGAYCRELFVKDPVLDMDEKAQQAAPKVPVPEAPLAEKSAPATTLKQRKATASDE